MPSHQDYVYMARAIQLAKKGAYTTDPNPCVGCVLVKYGQNIGEGWHQRAGARHAEVEALMNSIADVQGATAYVSLEPCSHYGKTPPCCDTLIDAGIQRVVIAMEDPNPLVAGNGLRRLRDSGIAVECGVLAAEAEQINLGFIKRMKTRVPYVISKLASSFDGRTALASGESKWVTSQAARTDVHRLRASSSAILTGINTVIADDPAMNARLNEDIDVVQPVRVVLDSTLKMPATARMAQLPGRSLLLTCSNDTKKKQVLLDAGFEVFNMTANKNNQVDLPEVMAFLGQQQINLLMVEAGPVLNGALLSSGLVDEWVHYMAPAIMGDGGKGLFNVPDIQTMADKIKLELNDVRQVGPDLRIKFTRAS